MEMLVTKFSNGKYRNEDELFAEHIPADNIKFMGEMIALQALRTVKKYDIKVADRLYIGLIKNLHQMHEIDYIVSDGYDVAQTAIYFLYRFAGRKASGIYGKDKRGKELTIKLACYREVDRFIDILRNRSDRRGPVEYIDFTDYKALPMDPVNCFEKEQTDYSKYDELLNALKLPALELAILNGLYERNGTIRSLRRTRHRQRDYTPPKDKHQAKDITLVSAGLISHSTACAIKRQPLYSDCLLALPISIQ